MADWNLEADSDMRKRRFWRIAAACLVVIKKRPKSIRFAVSRTDTTEEEEKEDDRTSGAKSEVTFGSFASVVVAVEITVADESDHEFA